MASRNSIKTKMQKMNRLSKKKSGKNRLNSGPTCEYCMRSKTNCNKRPCGDVKWVRATPRQRESIHKSFLRRNRLD